MVMRADETRALLARDDEAPARRYGGVSHPIAAAAIFVVVVVAVVALSSGAFLDNTPGTRLRHLSSQPSAMARGWCSILDGYYVEANAEIDREIPIPSNPLNTSYSVWPPAPYAIYPRRLYDAVRALNHTKTIAFSYRGGFLTDPPTEANRGWVRDFAVERFTPASYLKFTDERSRAELSSYGVFDHTHDEQDGAGYVPKEHPMEERKTHFDAGYFETMTKARFCLCPRGDAPWSMRFYEAILAECVPVLLRKDDQQRTPEEMKLPYRYFTVDEPIAWDPEMAVENLRIFMEYHMLS